MSTEVEPFSKVIKDYLMPSRLGSTLMDIIAHSADERVMVQGLLPLFQKNPAYGQCLLMLDFLSKKVTQWKADDPEGIDNDEAIILRILGLLGKGPIRNLVASARMNRGRGTGLPKKQGEKMAIKPNEQLRFAIAAEDFCLERSFIHPEEAYNAGLHYDWILNILLTSGASKEIKKVVDGFYKEGLFIGKIAYEIARMVPSVKMDRYVFAVGLVLPLGRLLMDQLFPAGKTAGGQKPWPSFLADCEVYRPKKRQAIHSLEKSRFPILDNELAALYMTAFELLAPIEKAVFFYKEPYFLREGEPELFQLAMIVSVADALACLPRDTPVLSEHLESFHMEWLGEVGIGEEVLAQIRQKAYDV
ncbi:hypothetical protein WDW86_11560 [Bdellovibrionota bacterium FG-2]